MMADDDGGFGGEAFLFSSQSHSQQYTVPLLPNYTTERIRLGISLIVVVVFWFIIVPLIGHGLVQQHRHHRQQQQRPSLAASDANNNNNHDHNNNKKEQSWLFIKVVGIMIDLCSVIMCLLSVGMIVMTSSNNSYGARGVFEAPLLLPEECQQLLNYSYEAAQTNVERHTASNNNNNIDTTPLSDNELSLLLQEPGGWQKLRHSSYPTTDLNLVTDPFPPRALKDIGRWLDGRLAPLITRIYGIPPRAVRAYDMFVVRYDSQRTFLESHTDSGYISFNVLLSDDFEGGGTRFWNRLQNDGRSFATVRPPVGHVLLNSALIKHEGLPITRGVRHIFVGFLAVDPIDPLTTKPTGLSWFASWLSLPFLHVRLKEAYVASHARLEEQELAAAEDSSSSSSSLPTEEATTTTTTTTKWMDNRYVRSLVRDLILWIEWLGDYFAPHFHVSLVLPQDSRRYLKALEDAPHETSLSWFQGQVLQLDVDGSVSSSTSATTRMQTRQREVGHRNADL